MDRTENKRIRLKKMCNADVSPGNDSGAIF